jgi:hypothetical protein
MGKTLLLATAITAGLIGAASAQYAPQTPAPGYPPAAATPAPATPHHFWSRRTTPAPAATPAPYSPAPYANAPAQQPVAPAYPTQRAATRPGPAPLGAGQYTSDYEARGACGGDQVVWVNLGGSKAYHMQADKYYGHTKRGASMCQRQADASGFHASGQRRTN